MPSWRPTAWGPRAHRARRPDPVPRRGTGAPHRSLAVTSCQAVRRLAGRAGSTGLSRGDAGASRPTGVQRRDPLLPPVAGVRRNIENVVHVRHVLAFEDAVQVAWRLARPLPAGGGAAIIHPVANRRSANRAARRRCVPARAAHRSGKRRFLATSLSRFSDARSWGVCEYLDGRGASPRRVRPDRFWVSCR